jgi:uncharacterized protein (DUF433 family)
MAGAVADDRTLEEGLYSLREMSRYLSLRLHASPSTLLSWIRSGLAPGGHQQGRPTYGFFDLVSLLVTGWLRSQGVRLSAVRDAEIYLRAHLGLAHPFATEMIFTDGVDVLFKANPAIAEQMTAANRGGQEVWREAIQDALHGVHYGRDQLADWWEPARSIRLTPGLQFGAPCVAGTRVPTAQLAELVAAGEEPDRLARLYDIPERAVAEALAFEERLAHAA